MLSITSLVEGKCLIWRHWGNPAADQGTLWCSHTHMCSSAWPPPPPSHYPLKSYLFCKCFFCRAHILYKCLQEKDQAFFQSSGGKKNLVNDQWGLSDLHHIGLCNPRNMMVWIICSSTVFVWVQWFLFMIFSLFLKFSWFTLRLENYNYLRDNPGHRACTNTHMRTHTLHLIWAFDI